MSAYQQIYSQTRKKILKGELKPGTLLPAHREMSSQHSVSVATITKVINRLKEDGLVDTCRGMGTVVSDPASAGRRTANKTICVVSHMQGFQNDAISHAVQEVFAGSPWAVNTRCTHSNLEWYREYLLNCKNDPPAGMIWWTLHPSIFPYTQDILPNPCTRVVTLPLPCCIPGFSSDTVGVNGFATGEMTAEYLLAKGYKDFVFVSNARPEDAENSSMIEGITVTMNAHGVPFEKDRVRLFRDPHSFGLKLDPFIDAYNYVKQMLTRERPRLIIAHHDWVAIGAIRAIQDAGLSIPKDIAVISEDRLPALETMTSMPRITGVDSLLHYCARTAAKVLRRRLEGDDSPVARHEIYGRFIEGETA